MDLRPRYLAYGNGEFVATARESIYASPDGEQWTEALCDGVPCRTDVLAVAFGAGRFVAVGYWGLIYTSTDGLSWGQARNGLFPPPKLVEVIYTGTQFVARGAVIGEAGSDYLLTSPDGLRWTAKHLDRSPTGLAHANGRLFVGFTGEVNAMADGVTWKTASLPAAGNTRPQVLDVAYGNGQYLLLAKGGSSFYFYTSTDGLTWRELAQESEETTAITFVNGAFYRMGSRLATSRDGRSWWTLLPSGGVTAEPLQVAAYVGGRKVGF